jgi:translation initiation factor IF-1
MAKESSVEYTGVVTKCLPDAQFLVQLDEINHTVRAYIGGNMRKFQIRVIEGDRVKVEMSPYDMTRGRIQYRFKPGATNDPGNPPANS